MYDCPHCSWRAPEKHRRNLSDAMQRRKLAAHLIRVHESETNYIPRDWRGPFDVRAYRCLCGMIFGPGGSGALAAHWKDFGLKDPEKRKAHAALGEIARIG